MAEEKRPSEEQGADHSPAPQGASRRTTRGQQRRHQRSVFQYITILFAAAFVLMLFTFLMERRANLQQIDDLQQNTQSATQRLEDIIAQRDQLKEENEQLQKDLEDANKQLNVQLEITSRQEYALSETCRALDRFWQIDEAYVRGRYGLCRSLIQEMEAAEEGQTPLKDYLPRESTTDNGRFSPYDRYQEIYEILY